MQDRQIAHVVVEMLVHLADLGAVPLAELCEGLAVDERTLRRRIGGLDWDLAVELIERLEARLGPERLRALAHRITEISPTGRRLLARVVGARRMLRFVFQTLGPTMYPMYDLTYAERELPSGATEHLVTLRLKEGFRGCQTLFDLHAISTAVLPTMNQEAPLEYRAVTSPRGGDYSFTVR